MMTFPLYFLCVYHGAGGGIRTLTGARPGGF
jgi:hypothetical protein